MCYLACCTVSDCMWSNRPRSSPIEEAGDKICESQIPWPSTPLVRIDTALTAITAGGGFVGRADSRCSGRGEAYSFIACLVICRLTTHPFRDGAPFLLQIETHHQHWALITFFPYMTRKHFPLSYPLPVSPSVATIYLLG